VLGPAMSRVTVDLMTSRVVLRLVRRYTKAHAATATTTRPACTAQHTVRRYINKYINAGTKCPAWRALASRWDGGIQLVNMTVLTILTGVTAMVTTVSG
jgi:hypothetical protein